MSKHYYMNQQRVATDITINYDPNSKGGGQQEQAKGSSVKETAWSPALTDFNEVLVGLGQKPLDTASLELPTLASYYPEAVINPATSSITESTTSAPRILFWHHPDYLGNVDLITERDGYAHEFFMYNPWGEEMHQWSANTYAFTSPYRFNAKELDPETGLAYYGARYYQNKLGVWLSVDPLALEEYNATMSPYNFTDNNPVMLLDPDGRDVVYFNRQGKEVYRIASSTKFTTFVIHKNADVHVMDKTHFDSKAGWVQAKMPNVIREKGDIPTTGSRYQNLDYQIAASTHLFNEAKNDGTLQLVTDGNAAIPTSALSGIPDLDPTLVKAIAMQESAIGHGGIKDVMQVNVGADWNEFKSKYGLSRGGATNFNLSINAGILVLATKGFKDGIDYNKTTGESTFKFQGWDKAVKAYNGGGTTGYFRSVIDMLDNSVPASPKNY